MEVDYNLINSAIALNMESYMLGTPTENRVVVAVNAQEKQTQSGLILPGQATQELPKKGVVVKKGPLNEDPTHELIKIGDVVQYGQYGGKEIFPTFDGNYSVPEGTKFFVLSSSEIIFIEPNKE